MRALLVVNPKATTFSSRVRDVLAHALASETRLELVETKARAHAVELATAACAENVDLVVALGGDGTVNEVVNGLMSAPAGARPTLAVVPGGSANVFARALGFPDDPVEATGQLLDALQESRRREIGLGLAEFGSGDGPRTSRWFTFCAGLGLDAEVVRAVERKRASGRRATPALYARTGVAHFFTSRDRRDVPLLLHGPDQEAGADPQPLGLALVCNSNPWTYLGPRPVQPCPRATFEGGLDLFGLSSLPTVATLRHLRQILSPRPRPRGRRVVQLHDVAQFTITADRPLAVQVDGDDLGDADVVRFRAEPSALSVVV
ncbi:MAG: diacylglycerol/lipid kinase family protein [Actinomycetes bacterium]